MNMEEGKRKQEKIKKGHEIWGAVGIDLKNKNIIIFKSTCVILAAGGYSRIYSVSSSRSFENYGEGVVLAYETGVDLVDMEMVHSILPEWSGLEKQRVHSQQRQSGVKEASY
jgi:succinate dehydrogenase/fumarate reductase flavoprotein subunit